MSWEKSSYTTAGAALLSESLSGGSVTITRAVSGTGAVETDLSAETAVRGETHELTLLGIDTVMDSEESARRIRLLITGAEESYLMHQVGVYGRLNDEPEVLLFLMQDERGIDIPSSGTNADFEIELSVLLAISTKASISIQVSPQLEALKKLIQEEVENHDVDQTAHSAKSGVPGGFATLDADGKLVKSQRPDVDAYKKAETDTLVNAAVADHNAAVNAHGDIRAKVAAMNARIDAVDLKFSTNVTKNPFSVTFGSLDGLTVTGVWDTDLARIEF